MKNAPAVGFKSWRQGAFLVALLAVGASATVVKSVSFSWKLNNENDPYDLYRAELTVDEDGIQLRAGGTINRFTSAKLTKDEAASLGRALLEAAGQPEKPCAATWPPASSLNATEGVCSCEAMVGGKCYCSKIGDLDGFMRIK